MRKNTIYKRLLEVQGGMTLRAFAEKIGVGQSTLHNYLKGRIPKADFIDQACSAMNVNERWILSGKGPKYRNDLIEESLQNVKSTIKSSNIVIQTDAKTSKDTKVDPKKLMKSEFVPVPLISDSAIKKEFKNINVNKDIDNYIVVPKNMLDDNGSYFCFKLKEDSMSPILEKGDIVGVNYSKRDPSALKGKMIAAMVEEGVIVRYLNWDSNNNYIFEPYNFFKFRKVYIAKDREVSIIGTVEWSWKNIDKAI
ncbi:XRE family transcriptional regulator [Thermodesulfobacteriota bacterium]